MPAKRIQEFSIIQAGRNEFEAAEARKHAR